MRHTFGIIVLKIYFWEFYTVRKKLSSEDGTAVSSTFVSQENNFIWSFTRVAVDLISDGLVFGCVFREREVAPISGRNCFHRRPQCSRKRASPWSIVLLSPILRTRFFFQRDISASLELW